MDHETLPDAKEDWDCPEQTEIDKGIQPDFPLTMRHASAIEEGIGRSTTRTARILS